MLSNLLKAYNNIDKLDFFVIPMIKYLIIFKIIINNIFIGRISTHQY